MEFVSGPGNVRRIRTLKRKKEEREQQTKSRVKLERVLGLTVTSNVGLDSAPASGLVAYPAGCTVVLYNPRKNRQTHITNPSRKSLTCLGFSDDGRFLVTGECGHLPSVRVWDTQDKQQVAEFPGHKYGINCVAFAPNNKYVVSVGSQHDMIVNVWDWKNNVKVASNKVSMKVKAISFAENGNYFVTAGNRHVKFWYLEYSRSKYKEPVPLMGRSAILGEQRNNYFCDVACGRGEMGDSTFAITKSGLLCEFNNRRLLDKWVELRTTNANCLSVGEDFIFIGCADGIVRCFSPHTLQFITTLPRTHFLGVDVSKGLNINHMASHPTNAKYPDATAVTYDEQNFKVTVIYNDHSIYVWDVRDIKKVGKSHSFVFHSACIWGLEMYPPEEVENQLKPVLPPGSFITCSSDDTIRIWNLSPNMPNNTIYRRNIYSEDLIKTLYVDSELSHLKENLDASMTEQKSENGTNNPNAVFDQRNGVRCIRISPDGRHLASGDRAGNVRVHELQFMDELCKIEAHDAEVLCLEYSQAVVNQSPNKNSNRKSLLASASRDRLIHVFNASRDYNFITTLDDHSSSITAVKFLHQLQNKDQLQMVSCGADKSIIFRDIKSDKRGLPDFSISNHVVGKTTLYDMEVDSSCKHILTACQDRNIRVYTVGNGKHSRTFKGSISEDGTLIKVALDNSGLFAATSSTDKTLAIFDYFTGECMATMFGHSELVTGLRFTNDCKHLISVSGDGCIFVWKLPVEMTSAMLSRLAQMNSATPNPNYHATSTYISNEEFSPSPTPERMLSHYIHSNEGEGGGDYRFSVGKLPAWAKKQVVESNNSGANPAQKGVDFPKGRWANRVGSQGITVKSHYDSDSVIPFPAPTSEYESKESSLENFKPQQEFEHESDNQLDYNSLSEIEQQRGTSPRQAKNRTNKKRVDFTSHLRTNNVTSGLRGATDESSLGSFNLESNDHDADIDDYSDGLTTQDDGGESTEPEHTDRTMYFGQADEKPSEYTVNAMDADELRKSQRKQKKNGQKQNNNFHQQQQHQQSQESDIDDDEEDEVSTPSAETGDKNMMSILSVSSENVDMVGRRAQFMKSNYESLSGPDHINNKGLDNSLNLNKTSISNQFREGTSAIQGNATTIARAQSFRDEEQNKKREELQRRIEETRKKLQNIGYRSMLKGSSSISDLSHIPEKEPNHLRGSGVSGRVVGGGAMVERPKSTEPSSSDPNYLRRACSLSDLNRPNVTRRILPAPPTNVSGKKHPSQQQQQSPTKSVGGKVRSHAQAHLEMTKRLSREAMNNSPSSGPDEVPSYMRSTSASTKKGGKSGGANTTPTHSPVPVTSNLGSGGRRRSSSSGHQFQTQSTSDLRQTGNHQQQNDDSSSEESMRVNSLHGGSLKSSARSGGRRSSSHDRRNGESRRSLGGSTGNLSHLNPQLQSRSERDLTKVTKVRVRNSTTTKENNSTDPSTNKQRTKMKTTTMIVNDPDLSEINVTKLAISNVDVVRAPLNWQLAESTAQSLQQASDNLIQLYKRISLDHDLEESTRTDFLSKLSSSAGTAQQTLRLVNNPAQAAAAASSSSTLITSNSHSVQAVIPNLNQPHKQQHHQVIPSELQSNPYFQHMVENYNSNNNNNVHQNIPQHQQQHLQQGSPRRVEQTVTISNKLPSKSSNNTNQGPSWL